MRSSRQQEKIQQKEASTPDALKRDPTVNYTEGYFFVTLNVRDEAPVLSVVTGHVEAALDTPDAPHCEYKPLGRKVLQVWQSIPTYHPFVEVLDAEAMPEHFHGLLYMRPGGTEHLGRVINGFMIGCTHAYWDSLGIPWREMKKSAAAQSSLTEDRRARAEWQDRDHTCSFRGPSLFVRGYNAVEPVTEQEVEIKKAYIRNQAERRLIQGDRHECFRVRRAMKSRNWTPERVMRGLCVDRFFARSEDTRAAAWQKVVGRLRWQALSDPVVLASFPDAQEWRLVLDLVGNMELLERPLVPLVCHRADVDRYDEQVSAVLSAARHDGAVVVTAGVSPREREIVKMLQQEWLPVIEVMDNGFADRYKPAGLAFYAMAEMRRLEVTPWTYVYDGQNNASPTISREMCMVMNEVVRTITNKTDDWWKNDNRQS